MIILERLRYHLGHLVRELPEVSFVLSEIRRFLEFSNDDTHRILKFYCNWALHSELRGPEAQNIVRLFDAHTRRLETMPSTGPTAEHAIPELLNIASMEQFRVALKNFLIQTVLPVNFVDIDVFWNEFITGYLMIIHGCPLRCISQGLQHVEIVTISVSEIKGPFEADISDKVRARILWRWQSLSGNPYAITTEIKDNPVPPFELWPKRQEPKSGKAKLKAFDRPSD